MHHRTSKDREHASVRSKIISACCGPEVDLNTVSEVLEFYTNRNVHKLKMYKERREEYMAGKSNNMSGCRYSADQYGFTTEVVDFMKD